MERDRAREELRKQLTLVHGGGQSPVARLGIQDRAQVLSRRQLVLMFATKLLLLASVLYCIYG